MKLTKQEIEIVEAIEKAPHLTKYILKQFDKETVEHVREYFAKNVLGGK